MMRYLCDHATKCKELQLGYKGKQWGIINRKALQTAQDTSLPFPPGELGYLAKARFTRFLRRAPAYHRTAPCVFGYHVLHGKRKAGIFYGSKATVLRLYALALQSVGLEPELKA